MCGVWIFFLLHLNERQESQQQITSFIFNGIQQAIERKKSERRERKGKIFAAFFSVNEKTSVVKLLS
jgi:hypothetical protein